MKVGLVWERRNLPLSQMRMHMYSKPPPPSPSPSSSPSPAPALALAFLLPLTGAHLIEWLQGMTSFFDEEVH